MSVLYTLTFICDSCGEEYMVGGEAPSMPSHWIGSQIMIGDKDGTIPMQEESSPIMHFCCRECFYEYVASEEFRERVLLADQDLEEREEEGDEEETE